MSSVTSIEQSYLASTYAGYLTRSTAASTTEAEENNAAAEETDAVTLSKSAQQLPPPPHEMDFENMSGDELKDYLQQMYEVTGTLPGGMEGSVDELDDETLEEIRGVLVEMSENSAASKALSSQEASSLTGADYKSLLTMFLMEAQTSLTTAGTDDSSSSWFSASGSDSLIQYFLAGGSSETSSLALQQALAAYQENLLDV